MNLEGLTTEDTEGAEEGEENYDWFDQDHDHDHDKPHHLSIASTYSVVHTPTCMDVYRRNRGINPLLQLFASPLVFASLGALCES